MPLSITFTFSPGAIIFASRFNQNFSDVQVWANAHEIATTGVHGVGAGQIVGTSLTQTIFNKTFSAPLLFDNTAAGDITATLSGVSADIGLHIFPKGAGKVSIGTVASPQGKLHIQGPGATRDGGWTSSVEIQTNSDSPSLIFSGQTASFFGGISWNGTTSGQNDTQEIGQIDTHLIGTAGYMICLVNPSVGTTDMTSGSGFYLDGLLKGMGIGNTGTTTGATLGVYQFVRTSGNFKAFEVQGAAHTGLTASAEIVDVDLNLARIVQRATGAVATQRAMRIQAPTYSFVGASTITTASTLAISGAPAAGANATITNAYSLNVEAGNSFFGGNVTVSAIGIGGAPTAPIYATGTAQIMEYITSSAAGGTQIELVNSSAGGKDWIIGSLGSGVAGRVGNVQFWNNSNSVNVFELTPTGEAGLNTTSFTSALTIAQRAVTSGTLGGITFTGAAHTGMTASTEVNDVNLNFARTVQWATGALTTQRAMRIQAPTYAFVGASTITDAITLAISGAPAAGANATITNPMALRVEAGASSFGGSVGIGTKSPTTSIHIVTTTGLDGINVDGSSNPRITIASSGTIKGTFAVATGAAAYLADSVASDTIIRNDDSTKKILLGCGTSGNSSAQVTNLALNIGAPSVATSGTPTLMTITGAAHTGQTASTEVPQINFNLAQTRQWATGNFAAQREVKIAAPTYSAVGASTITAAATLYVSGAPAAGANMTLTNSYAAWFGAGIRIDNTVALGGGAAPTFGTIGGAGPATAAQNSWMRVDDATGARWVPCWR